LDLTVLSYELELIANFSMYLVTKRKKCDSYELYGGAHNYPVTLKFI